MPDPNALYDLSIYLQGVPAPLVLTRLSPGRAWGIRDALSHRGPEGQVPAGWYDADHDGDFHRIAYAQVAGLTISPTRVPRGPRSGNVLALEDGSFIADGTDPQIPLGTPVGADGTPLPTGDGSFS